METLTYERIGREVANAIGKKRPVTKQQVSSWFAGSVPGMQLGLALALVLEIDPYSLGLTSEPKEASPPPPVIRGEQQVPFTPTPPGHAKKHRGA